MADQKPQGGKTADFRSLATGEGRALPRLPADVDLDRLQAERDAAMERCRSSSGNTLDQFVAFCRDQAEQEGLDHRALNAALIALRHRREQAYQRHLASIDWHQVAQTIRSGPAGKAPRLEDVALSKAYGPDLAKLFGLRLNDLAQGLRALDLQAAEKTPAKKQARADNTADIQYVIDAEDLTYMHPVLACCFLPHRDVSSETLEWSIHHMNNSLFIDANKLIDPERRGERRQCHVPWGGWGRLIMAHLHQQGMKSQTVNMGSSMRAFMAQHKVPIAGTSGRDLQENALNIGAADITVATWEDEKRPKDRRISICREHEFWLEKDGRQCVIWEPEFVISDEYLALIRERSVPVFFPHLVALRKYPMAWDIYNFLNWRLPQIKAPLIKIPHEATLPIFWHHHKASIDLEGHDPFKLYRKALRREFRRVFELYPDARVELETDYLVMRRSPPVVPRKSSVRGLYLPKKAEKK